MQGTKNSTAKELKESVRNMSHETESVNEKSKHVKGIKRNVYQKFTLK